MIHWLLVSSVLVLLPIAPGWAQASAAPGNSKSNPKPWTPPKTPWGDPDLQGVWPGTEMVGTPLQRDPSLGTRATLSDAEYAQRVERAKRQSNIDSQETVTEVTRCDPTRGGLGNTQTTCSNGVSIGPPLYWDDRGKPNRQASLVVDPPDGRIPPLTAAAQKSAADRGESRRARACARTAGGCHDSWEDESLWDRCITRGLLGSILPSTYNDGNQILQAPGLVVLRNEMIHESRIVPLDGRPHAASSIRSWMGDSRGHWEGNTLVVETTNFNEQTQINNATVSGAARVTERFTRTGVDTLDYRVTIDDPQTWTKPWSVEFPLKRDAEYRLYEYACHEGNYYMYNALTGARAEERKGAQ
jgi:hypothetical protein